MAQRMTATESKLAQNSENLVDNYLATLQAGSEIDVARSASSRQNENAGVMHGELNYTGPG